jgi:hypothetical protein
MSPRVFMMALPYPRSLAMFADLLIYILICLFFAGAIRRVGQVCSIYESPAVDSTLKSSAVTRMR